MEVSINGGTARDDGFGKSDIQMDENWGYLHDLWTPSNGDAKNHWECNYISLENGGL